MIFTLSGYTDPEPQPLAYSYIYRLRHPAQEVRRESLGRVNRGQARKGKDDDLLYIALVIAVAKRHPAQKVGREAPGRVTRGQARKCDLLIYI